MASIGFNSNTTVHGTQKADLLFGNDTTGVNNNDIIYGLGGNDTIRLNNTTDLGSNDVVYGHLGDDSIVASGVIDMTVHGGQGNDTIFQSPFGVNGALYGDAGNDLIEDFFVLGDNGEGFMGSSALYGGAGNDTLIAMHTGGDTMSGGQGRDLFVANDFAQGQFNLDVGHLVTVTDFLSGNDSISMSNSVSGPGNLVKENDPTANNASAALLDANDYYASHPTSDTYLFIYGGSGAGYLFYNGNNTEGAVNFPQQGMILVGDNKESSLSASDIIASPFAHAS